MNTCANESCNTNILDNVKYCGKCHAQNKKAKKTAARKRKNKNKAREYNHNPYDMKHRTDKSGGLKTGMGLSYLKQLDRQRWEKKQWDIAKALENWGWAILKLVDKDRHEQLRPKKEKKAA